MLIIVLDTIIVPELIDLHTPQEEALVIIEAQPLEIAQIEAVVLLEDHQDLAIAPTEDRPIVQVEVLLLGDHLQALEVVVQWEDLHLLVDLPLVAAQEVVAHLEAAHHLEAEEVDDNI